MKKTFRISTAVLAGIAVMFSLAACGGDDDEKPVTPPEPEITYETFAVDGVTFKMIAVDGGTFQMGSTGLLDERPVHEVTLSDYSIGETEVTQELWEAVMGTNPSSRNGRKLPVEDVTWDNCQTFIAKLNTLTGKTFRLPTEAEWEFAAKGGKYSKGYVYSGSDKIADVAWYGSNSSATTHEVGTKKPNELGLYDMSGNVWEWCADWKGDYDSEAQTNPVGPESGTKRICRGGSFHDAATFCRTTYRDGTMPMHSFDFIGFRLALTNSK